MRIRAIALAATLSFACGKDEPPAQAPPPPPAKPVRGAVGDTDLRVMLAEIVSAKACDMMSGTMRGLRADERPEVVTGVLWIRDCKITNDGTHVTFRLGGQGWQWADKQQEKAGATFAVRDYVKFAVDATIRGTIDIAYDRGQHVVSLWFSPTHTPEVKFTPLGDIDVDEDGLWASVLGGISSIVADSPEEQSLDTARQQGHQSFASQLARGMTVAIDLCTGYQRFTLGRPPKGKLGPPEPGESKRRPLEIQPGGMLAFGPYEAPRGMHVGVTTDGPIRVGIACVDDVYPAVAAFVAEQPAPRIATLAQRDVTGSGALATDAQRCKLAVVVRSLARRKVTFAWQRPPRESARSTGGPAIHCAREQTVSSGHHGSAGRAAARRR